MEKMRILIADDSPLSRCKLRTSLLSWDYDVVEVCDGDEAWNALIDPADPPRLAILDWYMPGMDGATICERLRALPTSAYCYTILLTSNVQRENRILGLKAGADDFLTKPFDPEELEQRVRAGVRIIELQDNLLATQETLRIQATRDALTEIWNRGAILAALKREFDRSSRTDESLGIIMADLDHFKKINDRFGHHAGDAVLRACTSRMESQLRKYDSIGRYGGEEFLIILPNTDLMDATVVAERLLESVSAAPIHFHFDGNDCPVTVTLGLTTAKPRDLPNVDTMIRAADEALYKAKEAGRNCVRQGAPALSELNHQANSI